MRIEKVCERCGTPYLAYPSGKPARFCSARCRMAWWRSRHLVVTIACDQCGTTVRRPPSGVTHAAKNHFCCYSCKGKWMSENLVGNRAPNWKGDGPEFIIEYIRSRLHSHPRWKAWAAQVRANANDLCERCGSPAEEAHHKREVAELLMLLLDPANGEALCAHCHHAHHSRSSPISSI